VAGTATAFVTGGGSGIGRAIAIRFAQDGHAVVCADLNLPAAEEVAAGIAADGGQALAVGCDVTYEASVAAALGAALAWTGRLDVVAANAGAMVEGGILSLSLADWRGALVFTASTVALSGMKGVAAYSAAKGAVAALTRQLAADFAADGVRVNAVAPGAVRTPLSESQFRARAADEAGFEALLDEVIRRYPLSRWGRSEEIAEIVHLLGTDRGAWITGQILPVDGGLLELR
jgi:NAD(P)-dependent dehydrogenase (short-subunit alcohol dehydrogenase family)